MRTTPHDNYRFRCVAGEKISKWHSFWLTTKRFRPLPYTLTFDAHGSSKYRTENNNIHTLFRKNFTTENKKVEKALLFITGDDIYKAYINGDFIGEGPAQAYPFSYNYNCYDVTDLIKSGSVNAIGVHVYYQGLFNIYLMSADNSHGMIAELQITYSDGKTQIISSDSSWKCKESNARTTREIFGYETQFSEDIDLNLWEDGWTDADYDISAWDSVCLSGNPMPYYLNLVPQITPTVKHKKVYLAKIEKIENGFFLDFGKEYVGSVALVVKGNKGDVIEIRCGEELNDDGSVRYDMRCNCNYQEFVTLTGREDFIEFFDFKGFRYAEIIGLSSLDSKNVWTFHRSYPFPENTAKFESSNDMMNKIWEICHHGVEIGTQDTYYDCPTREKGGFLADALITGASHYLLTGDIRVYKKFINDLADSARHFTALMCHTPSRAVGVLADFSFIYPLFLEEFYSYTGDLDFVKEKLYVADGVFEYFSRFENEDGLLNNIKYVEHIPCEDYDAILIDWPGNKRDGYDFKKAKFGVSTTVNGYYYGFLKSCEKLYSLAGDNEKSEFYAHRAEKVGESINNKCYDFEKGVYLDTPDSEHSAIHSNIIQCYHGLVPPNGFAPIVNQIKEKRLCCGVYFAYYVIGLLYRIGEYDLAYDLISGDDKTSWTNMVREGATTCMEVWGKDQKINTSWCHPWSSSFITFQTREIMGIKISKEGRKGFFVSPKIPDSLDWQKLDFPLDEGRFIAEFKRTVGGIEYTVSAPDSISVEFDDIKGIKFKRI